VTLVVNRAATTNMVVSSLNPSVPGLPVTYTATVNAVAPGAGTPGGTVTFYYGTNSFGTNSLVNGLASVTNAFLPVGTNLVRAVYSGDANFLGSTTLPWTQTVISLTSSQALAVGTVDHSGTVFLQSGLMLQYLTVSNVTAGTYSAVRVTLHLTQSGITVYDATGTNANGDAYLQHNYPVLPHSSVTFAVEYYVANRTTIPNPTISVSLVSPQTPLPVPKGTTVPIVQHTSLSVPDAFLVGFQTQLNATYDVLYSSDMINWTVVVPAVKGNGSEVQWLDLGPPLTQTPPSAQTQRCYQIIKVQ
jgi:Bacterial Ig-like domain (group 3)